MAKKKVTKKATKKASKKAPKKPVKRPVKKPAAPKPAPTPEAPKAEEKRLLTDTQFKELGEMLVHTGRNIYTVVRSEYGVQADDELFDELYAKEKVFRCENCNTWKPIGEHDQDPPPKDLNDLIGFCSDCMSDINDDDDDLGDDDEVEDPIDDDDDE
jgi:hypothetical protein